MLHNMLGDDKCSRELNGESREIERSWTFFGGRCYYFYELLIIK